MRAEQPLTPVWDAIFGAMPPSPQQMGWPSLAQAPGSEDDAMGMTWWNGMSQPERHEVLRQAEALIRGASVAQAWRLWKANRITMTPPNK